MRAITVSELINELLQAKQPHARVEVRGEATCDSEEHLHGYNSFNTKLTVTSVRSVHGIVILEGEA